MIFSSRHLLSSPLKAEVMSINCLIQDTKGYNYYLSKEIREDYNANPINELHIHPIPTGTTSIKMPTGYRMAFSTLLYLDGVSHYLIKRQRSIRSKLGNDPETFKYKASIMSVYPSLSEGAAMNTLKLLFPNGCEVVTKPKTPVHQSCYITVDESSLEQYMLSFIKYYEKTSPEFATNVSLYLTKYSNCNFRQFEEVYVEKAIGFISKHHDNRSAEHLLRYIYDYIHSSAVPVPIEVS